MLRLVKAGEKGFDVSTHYPSAKSALAQGYTFMAGYDSTNPPKNLPLAKAQEYIDAGITVFYVYEINAGRTTLGGTVGKLDGTIHKQHMDLINYPVDAPSIAANDTDTTNANIFLQTAYHNEFKLAIQKSKGLYGDIDIGYATEWELGWLPNAWSWDHPNPRLKSESIKAARALGYHIIQGRLTDNVNEPSYDVIDGINVDINWCIKDCYGWGNPILVEEPMTPYIFKLADGRVGIRHDAGSRDINDGELTGPFVGERVYDVPKGSNWETWITSELAKYERDLNPVGVVFPTKFSGDFS